MKKLLALILAMLLIMGTVLGGVAFAKDEPESDKEESEVTNEQPDISKEKDRCEALAEDYMRFLANVKTEREFIKEAIKLLKKAGFKDITEPGSVKELSPGDRVYYQRMNKTIAAFVIGTEPMAETGLRIMGAHSDSPHIDIKQQAVYESDGLVYLDTHYYGAIKNYQWVNIPLALHGIVVKTDGTSIDINIGEDEEDPVLLIPDLLIHLSSSQLEKSGRYVIESEDLDAIIGSPMIDDGKDVVVLDRVLELITDKYGFDKADFESADLMLVPAGKPRDTGLDRSMIAGYGHDDKSCAYTSLMALIDYKGTPDRTLCCAVFDKEEIGSDGATGAQSNLFEQALAEVMELAGESGQINVTRAMSKSDVLSNDVNAAYDPLYSYVFDAKTASHLGRGIAVCKFTGSGGKYEASEANAEYTARLRSIMEGDGIPYQFCELGKIDMGGGGTIAKFFSRYGMDVIDTGLPVMSMHSPWEIISKADLYTSYRFYCEFFRSC